MADLDMAAVSRALDHLVERGFVEQGVADSGEPGWAVTSEGMSYVRAVAEATGTDLETPGMEEWEVAMGILIGVAQVLTDPIVPDGLRRGRLTYG